MACRQQPSRGRRIPLAALACLLATGQAWPQAAVDASDEEILAVLVPEWGEAALVTMADLTEAEARKLSTSPWVGRRFEGDFNDDGRPDLALFGVDPAGDETADSFLLIATRTAAVWQRSGLLRFEQPFILGLQFEDSLRVGFCVACDYGGAIVWNGASYVFVPSQAVGVTD